MSLSKHNIDFLDFLRGWSAIVVFVHHAAILLGGPSFLAGHIGSEAVNVFMFSSGFLIYFQCSVNSNYSGFKTMTGVRVFFIRRFFRIAPTYYIFYLVSLGIAGYLGDARQLIAEVLPGTATDMRRYDIENPVANFFMHITFLFGVFPSFSFSTPLPDWSLGLEMQFYLLFPIVFYLLQKNFLLSLLIVLIVMLGLRALCDLLEIVYPMASYLPLKFHNFAAGMAVAHLMMTPNKNSYFQAITLAVILVFLWLGNETSVMSVLFLFSFWFLCKPPGSETLLRSVLNRLFNDISSKFLADISYVLYLSHLLLMLPYGAYVVHHFPVNDFVWMINTLGLLAVVMLISFAIHRCIERPSIQIGKQLIHKFNRLPARA